MKLLPIDFPDLSETPLQRKLKQWKREDEHQRLKRLRLWQELRVKVEKLPTLMDEAQAKAEASGRFAEGYIDGSAVGELLYEIEQIRREISIDGLL